MGMMTMTIMRMMMMMMMMMIMMIGMMTGLGFPASFLDNSLCQLSKVGDSGQKGTHLVACDGDEFSLFCFVEVISSLCQTQIHNKKSNTA